jgi:hypothetical protein
MGVPPYQDKDHALVAERVAAEARRIDNPHQIVEKTQNKTIRLKGCSLRESAYCVIEKPLRKTSLPSSISGKNSQ